LVNACPADLRALVRAALLTGARCGELVGLKAQDVDLRAGRIYLVTRRAQIDVRGWSF
jgi:integrase